MSGFIGMLAKRRQSSAIGSRADYWYSRELLNGLPANPVQWYGCEDDFDDLCTGKYTTTQVTAGSITLEDAERGGALIDCGDTTVHHGLNLQWGKARFAPAAGKILIFSAYLNATAISTGPEFFLGGALIDTTIIASGAMSCNTYVGFKSVTADGILLACGLRTSGVEVTKTGTTLVSGTNVLLEFKVTGITKIEFFVNGQKLGSSDITTSTAIPNVKLAPSLAWQGGGTVQPLLHLDHWGMWMYDPALA